MSCRDTESATKTTTKDQRPHRCCQDRIYTEQERFT